MTTQQQLISARDHKDVTEGEFYDMKKTIMEFRNKEIALLHSIEKYQDEIDQLDRECIALGLM